MAKHQRFVRMDRRAGVVDIATDPIRHGVLRSTSTRESIRQGLVLGCAHESFVPLILTGGACA